MPHTRWILLIIAVLLAVLLGVPAVATWNMRARSPIIVDDTLIFLVPHPDDEVYSAAMTLAANVRAGRRVVVVLLTDGERSHASEWWIEHHGVDLDGDGHIDVWDFGLARRAEFEEAMRVLGVTEYRFFGVAGTQGTSGIRDGFVADHDLEGLVRDIAREYSPATLATVMKEIPGDPLGDIRAHDDHTAACDAVKAYADSHDETAYFFKPYQSLDTASDQQEGSRRIRGDAALGAARVEAIEAYKIIGGRSWGELYNAALESDLEFMVTSRQF